MSEIIDFEVAERLESGMYHRCGCGNIVMHAVDFVPTDEATWRSMTETLGHAKDCTWVKTRGYTLDGPVGKMFDRD